MPATRLKKLYETYQEHAKAVINAVAIAVTAGIEQLTTVAAYRCPCVSVSQLKNNGCLTVPPGNASCSQLLNFRYGLSYLFAPAVALLVFGIAISPKFWKSITGCFSKAYVRKWYEIMWIMTTVCVHAMIYPASWISVALLDGRFLACSVTALPYDVDREGAKYKSCAVVSQQSSPNASGAFITNRSYSQAIGWVLVSVLVFTGLILYAIWQCHIPLSYYQAKYHKLYKRSEEEAFDTEMKAQAPKHAKANVGRFMELRRPKVLWDRASSVYNFRKATDDSSLLSNLYDWVLEEKEKEAVEQKLLDRDCDGVLVTNEAKPLLGAEIELSTV